MASEPKIQFAKNVVNNGEKNRCLFTFVPSSNDIYAFSLFYNDRRIGLFKVFIKNSRVVYTNNQIIEKYINSSKPDSFIDDCYIIGCDVVSYYNLQVIVKDDNIVRSFLQKCNDMIVNKDQFKFFFEDKKINISFVNSSQGIHDLVWIVDILQKNNIEDDFLPITSYSNLRKFLDDYYKNESYEAQWKKFYNEFIKDRSASIMTTFALGLMQDVADHKKKLNNNTEIISDLVELVTKFPNLPDLINDFIKIIGKDYQEMAKILGKIDDIRKKLTVDSLDDINLWQYAPMSALKYLISINKATDINPNVEKNDVSDAEINKKKSRVPSLIFTNENKRHDPIEGKTLLNILSIKDTEDYKLSPFYISSATASFDSLPLWKQYADGGKGICLHYTSEYLKSIKERDNINIFRVCYINDNLDIKITGIDPYKQKKIIDEIQEDLKTIKQGLENIGNNTNETKKEHLLIINFINAEIGYLFKSMTYSYENEYRISLNMKDKSEQIETDHIDDSTIKLHAYIQDDNGQRHKVMYKDVIIGPKVKDIDYVAPYIKLCDGTINVRKSKIKYR